MTLSMDHSKRKGLLWGVSGIIAATLLPLGFNWFVDLIPPSMEVSLAKKLPSFNDGFCLASNEATAALEKIRRRLLQPGDDEFSIHLQVIKAHEVNAFAFLGGAIFINTGLLREALNADEVAGVIAHEMSHVRNRDVLHAISGKLLTAVLLSQLGDSTTLTKLFTHIANLKYTRSQEEKADRGAIEQLKAVHIKTQPLADFFKRLPTLGAFASALISDHPDSDARAQMAASAEVKDPRPALEDKEWEALKSICAD